MIITSIKEVNAQDLDHFSWTSLRQFQNTSYTTKKICEYHSIYDGHVKNIQKQSQQIRYCLIQAEEYFISARVASLATKPVLLYYGVMSLVLAEILIKQSGDSSLDRARGQHAHHGLDFRIDFSPSREGELAKSAAALRALPLIRGEERFGTFELWHRTTREAPQSGVCNRILSNGVSQSSHVVLGESFDIRPELLPAGGVTLLDCLRSIPQMIPVMQQNDILPMLARGSFSLEINDIMRHGSVRAIIHPTNEMILSKVYEKFLFKPAEIPKIKIQDIGGGCIITIKNNFDDYQYPSKFPTSFQSRVGELYFSSGDGSLNELGLIYVGLFILGNYARYFPDHWMVDVENSSALALAAAEFLMIAAHRAPILALSELSQVWHLISAS